MRVFNQGLLRIDNAMVETDGTAHILGAIESVGWRLEHVGYTVMEKASMGSLGQHVSHTWTAGQTIGIYLFRRALA